MRSKKDGAKIPGSEGTISKEAHAAALGLDTGAAKPAPLPLTPNQARRAQNDEWVEHDIDPPDWERSTVSSPDAVAKALGLRQSDFDTVPLGSAPEGQPIPQSGFRPKVEARPKGEGVQVKETKPDPAPDEAAQRAALAAAAREGKRLVAMAQSSGKADAETIGAATRLAQKIAAAVQRLP